MKKQYSKPGIIIENFELLQSIAAGCGAAHNSAWGSPSHDTKLKCGWIIVDLEGTENDVIAWTSASGACNDHYKDTDIIEGICYNNPGNGMNIFSS